MGGSGGPVITSFGQKPKQISKPKPVPKKDDSDDIFASMGMGLASYTPSKQSRPAAPSTGGWQAQSRTQSAVSAPKSAPLPSSLLADALDDDGDADSWGDDGDLDDLLDD